MKRIAEAKFNHWEAVAGLPIRLHLRNDLHLLRKTWHLVMGSLIAMIYFSGISCTRGVLILSFFLGLDILVETARLRVPAFNERVMRVMGPLMRESEATRMSGTPAYILSAILAVGIFPKPVAILSILYLAFGDPAASLVGILYGKNSIKLAKGKSLVGTAAGVATCILVSYVFLSSLSISDGTVLVLSIVGGLAGGLAELLPVDVDDNFIIPIASGFVLWMAFILAGI